MTLQIAGEGDKALAQLAGLVRQVAGASLQGPVAVVALKAARTVVARRPSLVGRLAPALLAVAGLLASGLVAGLMGSSGMLQCWLWGSNYVLLRLTVSAWKRRLSLLGIWIQACDLICLVIKQWGGWVVRLHCTMLDTPARLAC